MQKIIFIIILISLIPCVCFALEPNEILIIANSDLPASIDIADYYCAARQVPQSNIFAIPLGCANPETINRADYDKLLAAPIREKLNSPEFTGKIKCLLTVYGVPIKVGPKPPAKNQQLKRLETIADVERDKIVSIVEQLKKLGHSKLLKEEKPNTPLGYKPLLKKLRSDFDSALKRIEYLPDESEQKKHYRQWLNFYKQTRGPVSAIQIAAQNQNLNFSMSFLYRQEVEELISRLNTAELEKWDTAKRFENDFYKDTAKVKGSAGLLAYLVAEIAGIKGIETAASVDSELSMVLFDDYPLYRWQPNELKSRLFWFNIKTLMVARLDGPGQHIAKAIIDKAIKAETNGLHGRAYIDIRSLPEDSSPFSYGYYDKSLADTAVLITSRTDMTVVREDTEKLFAPGKCPQTALYCGWYSVRKYIDAFDFVDGAVGYHIASYEAQNLRDPKSRQWCPSMLKDGITATLGPVAEPYLQAFPEPKKFFAELLSGKCLVEVYYRTKPYNSWQMVLIGDPLYKINIPK